MEKRLSKSDYIFTLIFLFMLMLAVGAFFYGLKVGQERIENKYQAMFQKENLPQPASYDQQYLVSFYHTILQPFREFQKKWFEHMDAISLDPASVDSVSMLNELGKLAGEKYDRLSGFSMPASSPLLQNAQQNYMKSLKLFSEAIDKFQKKAAQLKGQQLIDAINQDAYFQQARNFALQAQQDYYSSIVKWNETVDPLIRGLDIMRENQVSLEQWKQLNLNEKNNYIAKVLHNNEVFAPYFPQDMAARVDELIATGNAHKLQLKTIGDAIQTLINTGAVRPEDFRRDKMKYYANELLPQLPFFID
ncbi:hypothetical protein [Ferviditalea candida]|uniref:DUF885 domain-containing protein n=1 Tax=Ferviditalea candida TaxID=3108399 RepID=A0ABU5ZJV6_9BACL|nr:hypothetical protein [Paenibacillaceae bacterium T2]